MLIVCERATPEADAGRRLTMNGATGRSRPAESGGRREPSSFECFSVGPVMGNRVGDADTSKRASGGKGGLSGPTSKLGRDLPPDFRLFLRNQLPLFFSISFPFGLAKAATGNIGSEGSSLGKGAKDEGFAVVSRLSALTLSEGTCLSMPLRAGKDVFGAEPGPIVAAREGAEGGLVIINSGGILRGDLSAGGTGTSTSKDGGGGRGAVSALSVSTGSADKPGGSGIGCDIDAGESVGSRWCE